jgi:ferredoxin
LGSIMGSGGMVVLNNESCMVDVARYFMSFTQSESCGKCTPCREGTKRLLEMLTNMTRGVGGEKDIEKIKLLSEFVRDNSLCGLGQNAPNPILSTLRFYKEEYEMHVKDKKCCAGACSNLLKYFITDKCVGCGNCAKHCPVQCISGEPRKRFSIDQDKCIKCGTCYEVCAFKAIVKN